MRTRVHTNDDEQRPTASDSLAPPEDAALQERRAAAQRFLAAGDAAIQRALSSDSARFLAANQQEGGQ